MNCPLCVDQTLDITHRLGIELDICPKCHGIWLDRGEIDRLIAEDAATDDADSKVDRSHKSSDDRDRDRKGDDDDRKKKRKRKKKSLASRIGDAIEDALDELT